MIARYVRRIGIGAVCQSALRAHTVHIIEADTFGPKEGGQFRMREERAPRAPQLTAHHLRHSFSGHSVPTVQTVIADRAPRAPLVQEQPASRIQPNVSFVRLCQRRLRRSRQRRQRQQKDGCRTAQSRQITLRPQGTTVTEFMVIPPEFRFSAKSGLADRSPRWIDDPPRRGAPPNDWGASPRTSGRKWWKSSAGGGRRKLLTRAAN